MDKKRLVIGLSVLLMIGGLVLIGFAPGGFFNPVASTIVDMPWLTVEGKREVKLGMPGPVAGFVLLGVGALGVVIGLALKNP